MSSSTFPPPAVWGDYAGHATFTVPLNPGKNNTAKLTGGHGGVNIDSVAVSPIDS